MSAAAIGTGRFRPTRLSVVGLATVITGAVSGIEFPRVLLHPPHVPALLVDRCPVLVGLCPKAFCLLGLGPGLLLSGTRTVLLFAGHGILALQQ